MKALERIRGIVGNDLLMLFGDTGSGKSKICYALAKEAVEAGQKVIFLDTERNLSNGEIKELGASYIYTPIFAEIKKRVSALPPADLIIVDSIGLPVLIQYSRMNMRERLYALLEMATMLGDLKDWTFRNNALAIVTNQPTSEYMPEEKRKTGRKVWGLANGREPFGGKSKHVAKEIWYLNRISGDRRGTRIVMIAFRSRELASGLMVAEGKITDAGLALDFKLGQPVSDDMVQALLEEMTVAQSEQELQAIGEKLRSLSPNLTIEQRNRLRDAYRIRRDLLQRPAEEPFEERGEPAKAEEVIHQAQEQLEEVLAEAEAEQAAEDEARALKEAQATGMTLQMEDVDELWPYAKAKGIPDGIVHEVLEQTGGAVEETLERLKERYGE